MRLPEALPKFWHHCGFFHACLEIDFRHVADYPSDRTSFLPGVAHSLSAQKEMRTKKLSSIVLFGVFLAGAKLALLPFQAALRTSSFSDLSDCALALLLAVTAFRSSRRASAFARTLWLSVAMASILWSISFAIGALAYAFKAADAALNVFWPTTIIFYLVFLVFALPLLLKEDAETVTLGWAPVLDLAQIGILTFSAYLVFFYIPSISGISNDLRSRNYMMLQLARNGFLAAGFLYRSWRSRSAALRQLQFRLGLFFITFGAVASFFLRALNVWRWPHPLVGFASDLPLLFLLFAAAHWQPQAGELPPVKLRQTQPKLWRQILPLAMPFSVIALGSQIARSHPWIAWSAITSSFICYAARLIIMQRRQDATLLALSAMEKKFSTAFHSSPIAICLTRLSDGRYVDANDRYLELVRLPRNELIGKTSLELGIFPDLEQRSRFVKTVLRESSFRNRTFRLRRADRTLDTLISAEVIQLENESLIISSLLDVTELKSVTQQLQRAQKMELIGSLAGGVAHDFNNLLTIIKGYSELARTRESKANLAEEIRHIGEAADRAAALTRQLMAFSRHQVLQPRKIGLNSVIVQIEKLLHRTIGENIELVTILAPDLGAVFADPVQMEQVVMNLAVNSRDAMPNGGKLVFQTRNLELSSPYLETGFEIPLGHYVMFSVTDTGVGIAPEHLDRIFEPFFTTKGASHGTGLGLATVYGIVKQSGGYISVYSEVGLGTTFKIYLPRVDQPADVLKPAVVNGHIPGGAETILIAEDDQRLCQLATDVLRQRGYRVLAANSGEEALQRANEFENKIDLLLADIVMPGIGGYELARQLKGSRPGLKVLYMSGYPHYSLSSRTDFHEPILAKPFTPSELTREIRRVLDGENHMAAVAGGEAQA